MIIEINPLQNQNKTSQILHENISFNPLLLNENNFGSSIFKKNDELNSNSKDENKLLNDDDLDFKSYFKNNFNFVEKKEDKHILQNENEKENKLINKNKKQSKPVFKITKVNYHEIM